MPHSNIGFPRIPHERNKRSRARHLRLTFRPPSKVERFELLRPDHPAAERPDDGAGVPFCDAQVPPAVILDTHKHRRLRENQGSGVIVDLSANAPETATDRAG